MADDDPLTLADLDDERIRPWYFRDRPLSPDTAAGRISAYVYGNVLVLAALVTVQDNQVTLATLGLVMGTALSTFVAHVFAEWLGSRTPHTVRGLLSESAPILTSGVFPTVVLALAWLSVIPSSVAIIAAEVVIVGRLAVTGMVVARLRDEESPRRVIVAGLLVGGLALLVVLLKVVLTH